VAENFPKPATIEIEGKEKARRIRSRAFLFLVPKMKGHKHDLAFVRTDNKYLLLNGLQIPPLV
jgi:hypothetical protein